jgi:hypothetical protein
VRPAQRCGAPGTIAADLLRIAIATLLLLGIHPRTAPAQDEPPRIGPFVLDVRGTSPSFPDDPQLAQSRGLSVDELPGRGLGLDAGAHVYLFKWRVITVGAGAQMTFARAKSGAVVRDGVEIARPVTSWFTAFTPQLSFNFGTGDGWSYISGGIGSSVWSTVPDGQPPLPGDEERLTTINYGGGARWFAKSHLAFTIDVRFHDIYPGTPQGGLPGSPRATIFIISAGVSLK